MFPVLKNKYKYKNQNIINSVDYIKQKFKIEKITDFGIIIYPYELKILKKVISDFNLKFKEHGKFLIIEDKITICITSIGAPNAAMSIDEMGALGCKKVINIGVAGSLCEKINISEVVLCDKALRDEGTSYHYIKPSKYSYACPKFTTEIQQLFCENGISIFKGPSWSTDAPYRETKKEFLKYSNEGVLAVEMESSAVFAVAEYYKLKSASVLIISDILYKNKWTLSNYSVINFSIYKIFSALFKKYIMNV